MRKADCFDFLAELTETAEFVRVSPGYTRLLGHESHEPVGRNGRDRLHPDDPGNAQECARA